MASETNRLHPLSGAMIPLQRGVTGLSIPVFLAGIAPTVLGVDADFAVDLLFVVASLGFVVGVGYGLAYYYRFAYALTTDTFDVTSGVLSRRAREIPYRRVQNVDVSQGIVQRLLGLAVVSIETAGGGSTEATLRFVASDEADRIRSEIRRRTAAVDDTSDASKQSTATDSVSETAGKDVAESRIYRFATALTGADRPDFRGASPLARRRYLVRYSLLAVGVVALAFGASRVTGLERWYLAAVAVAAAPPAAHLKYVNIGYHTGDEHIVIRRGFWRRRTTVIPYYRVQTVSTRRSIFQRRLGLASLVVDTASSRTFSAADPTIDDVDLETARTLHETCGERLQTALRDRAGDDVGLPVDPGDRP